MLFHIFYTMFQREHSNCYKNLAKADTEHNWRAVKTKSDSYSHKEIVTYLQFQSKSNVFPPKPNSCFFFKVCLASKHSICLKNAAIILGFIYHLVHMLYGWFEQVLCMPGCFYRQLLLVLNNAKEKNDWSELGKKKSVELVNFSSKQCQSTEPLKVFY